MKGGDSQQPKQRDWQKIYTYSYIVMVPRGRRESYGTTEFDAFIHLLLFIHYAQLRSTDVYVIYELN